MEGILTSCLYSFGCPELRQFGAEKFFFEFLKNTEKTKLPLVRTILEKLEPYYFYSLIGYKNNLPPFSQRVVRAHWLGNNLLKRIEKEDVKELFKEKKFQGHQTRFIKIFDLIGGKPHHNFSTLWLIKKIENLNPNLKMIEDCLVRAGKVVEIKEEKFVVETQRLVLDRKKLRLQEVIEEIPRFFLKRPVKFNDWISIHFGVAREKISRDCAQNLQRIIQEAILFFEE